MPSACGSGARTVSVEIRLEHLHDQDVFDAIAREMVDDSEIPSVLLDRRLRIRGLNTAYEHTVMRGRADLMGEYVYDIFPSNPDDPHAAGARNLDASLTQVLRTGRPHHMWVQRYDVPDAVDSARFVPKVWKPTNTPLIDNGTVVGVMNHGEEITEAVQALDAMARAIDADEGLSPAEQLHTMAVFSAAMPPARTESALAAENDQLRRALETRDIIGQAKGMLMERFNTDADDAFRILVKLSQDANMRVADVARRLVDVDHPPR
jgi:hypothetical protein